MGYYPKYLRPIIYAVAGAVLGYFVLPLVVPMLASDKLAWLISPLMCTVAGVIVGICLSFTSTFRSIAILLGGIIGALVGHFTGTVFSLIVFSISYEYLGTSDTFVFLDLLLLIGWVVFILIGSAIGLLIVKAFQASQRR